MIRCHLVQSGGAFIGSKELVGAEGGKEMKEKDIGVESAKVFISCGAGEPRLMTTEQADIPHVQHSVVWEASPTQELPDFT